MSCRSLLPIHSLSQFLEINKRSKKGRVPWAKLEASPLNYIKPRYLPKNVTFKQCHHLCKEHVNTLLEFWFKRQAAGKVPLRFRKSARSSASEENGSNAEMERPEEETLHEGSSGNCPAEQAHSRQSLGDSIENPMVSFTPERWRWLVLTYLAFAPFSCR